MVRPQRNLEQEEMSIVWLFICRKHLLKQKKNLFMGQSCCTAVGAFYWHFEAKFNFLFCSSRFCFNGQLKTTMPTFTYMVQTSEWYDKNDLIESIGRKKNAKFLLTYILDKNNSGLVEEIWSTPLFISLLRKCRKSFRDVWFCSFLLAVCKSSIPLHSLKK